MAIAQVATWCLGLSGQHAHGGRCWNMIVSAAKPLVLMDAPMSHPRESCYCRPLGKRVASASELVRNTTCLLAWPSLKSFWALGLRAMAGADSQDRHSSGTFLILVFVHPRWASWHLLLHAAPHVRARVPSEQLPAQMTMSCTELRSCEVCGSMDQH